MFFKLKRRIINSAIKKRNKNVAFNYEEAENFSLDNISDPSINNSYYYSAHDEEMSIFCRLGLRCNLEESWFLIFYKGKAYSLKEEFFEAGQSPLKVKRSGICHEISFSGILNDCDEVTFKATFSTKEKPLNFSTDMPSGRMATAMANEKWKKSFFSALDNVQGQTHYEQTGLLEGKFTLNREEVSFSLPCVRDHSFGKRIWDYMNNHLWLMGVSPSSQFNYSLVSYPVMSLLEVGNYYHDDQQRYLLCSDLSLEKIAKGEVPSSLKMKASFDDGCLYEVEVKVLKTFTYHFEDGKYILHENLAEFQIGEKKLRGILEIGFNADKSRFFNSRDLRRLKRR
ncbi:MAG: hypothetical protein K5694_05055 [Bacilli bacterium]|nr:hypothetical protein [Bacilli bacterium]